MRRTTQLLQTASLILVAGLIVAGCNTGSGEVRYINRTRSTEVLTFNRAKNVKTKIIYTFHGVSNGTYTLKTDKGTLSGGFSSDGGRIKFWPENGQAETATLRSDGSFDFAQGTWEPASVVKEKSLKAIVSSKEGAAAQ